MTFSENSRVKPSGFTRSAGLENPAQQPRADDGTFAAKTGFAAEMSLSESLRAVGGDRPQAPEVELGENIAYYQREVVETFERAIHTMTDMVETSKDSERLTGKRDGLVEAWERQGDRIRNAKSLRDLAAIIEFIRLEAEDAADAEKQGAELAISYLRQFVKYLPEER